MGGEHRTPLNLRAHFTQIPELGIISWNFVHGTETAGKRGWPIILRPGQNEIDGLPKIRKNRETNLHPSTRGNRLTSGGIFIAVVSWHGFTCTKLYDTFLEKSGKQREKGRKEREREKKETKTQSNPTRSNVQAQLAYLVFNQRLPSQARIKCSTHPLALPLPPISSPTKGLDTCGAVTYKRFDTTTKMNGKRSKTEWSYNFLRAGLTLTLLNTRATDLLDPVLYNLIWKLAEYISEDPKRMLFVALACRHGHLLRNLLEKCLRDSDNGE